MQQLLVLKVCIGECELAWDVKIRSRSWRQRKWCLEIDPRVIVQCGSLEVSDHLNMRRWCRMRRDEGDHTT